MLGSLKNILWNVISSNLPPDHDIEVLRKIILLNLIMTIGAFALSLLATLAFIQGDFYLSLIDGVMILVILGLFTYLRATRNQKAVGVIGISILGLFYSFLIAHGGVNKTAYVWLFTYPLISLFLLGLKLGSLVSILLLGVACFVFIAGPRIPLLQTYSVDLVLRIVPAYVIILSFSYIMEKVRSIVQGRLSTANVKLEDAFEEVQSRTIQLGESNTELQVEINERRRVDKALRDSESFLEDVIESIQDGISVLNTDLTIRHVNSVMKKWYREKQPLEGKICFECYHDATQPCAPCPSLRAISSGNTESDIVPGNPKSDVEWLELFSFPLKDRETGEITGVVEFVRDITQRRKVSEVLRKSEARIKKQNEILLRLARKKTMYGVDLEAAVREITETATHILNVERSSVWLITGDKSKMLCVDVYQKSTGKHTKAGELLVKTDSPYYTAMENERTIAAPDARNDTRTHELDKDYLTPLGITSLLDAPIRLGENLAGVVCNEHVGPTRQWHVDELNFAGSLADFVSMAIEAADRTKAEQEKRELRERLQRAEQMEALGTLAGGVAHDLNNVLSGVVSYPDLLLMQIDKDSTLRKPLKTIQESGKKAAAIVQDLLTLARRGVAVNEVICLNTVINNYFKSPEFERLQSFHPNVDISTNLAPDLLNIKGSAIHLLKTIMNLASNAAEAMPDGGQMQIDTANHHVDKPPARDNQKLAAGDYMVLSVADTGVGIPQKDREKIFEPFYTKKEMGRSGTGLGMAVVWGTVKDHQGFIEIGDAQPHGTIIRVFIPVTREKASVKDARLSVDEYTGNGESILVIDDEKEQREIATGMLTKLGYSVTSVPSGEEAVAYLQANTVDLLVLDMIMTGIDGLETYRRVLKKHPQQKAVIASGFAETRRVKDLQRLGAGQYLKKPYTLETIGLTVKRELKR